MVAPQTCLDGIPLDTAEPVYFSAELASTRSSAISTRRWGRVAVRRVGWSVHRPRRRPAALSHDFQDLLHVEHVVLVVELAVTCVAQDGDASDAVRRTVWSPRGKLVPPH